MLEKYVENFFLDKLSFKNYFTIIESDKKTKKKVEKNIINENIQKLSRDIKESMKNYLKIIRMSKYRPNFEQENYRGAVLMRCWTY